MGAHDQSHGRETLVPPHLGASTEKGPTSASGAFPCPRWCGLPTAPID